MMQNFSKKGIALLVVILIIVLLGSCTKTDQKTAQSSAVPDNTLNIATVDNPDMIIMQKASKVFTEQTGITVNFIVMDENELRRSVTEDVVIGGGRYDIVTIGTYDTPFWAKNKWIVSLEPFFEGLSSEALESYDRADLLKPFRVALSLNTEQYALPFNGESSMMLYRKDLFEAAGLTMPAEPTWQEIYTLAQKLNNPEEGISGIILRGGTGWGQNMVVINTMINTFGARWYDMDWNAQFNTPEMREALGFYKKIISETGEPNPENASFLECLNLMKEGKGAMWYDATSAAGPLEASDSKVAGKIDYAVAPSVVKKNPGWFWSWSLAIESSSQKKEAAFKFITWATSKEYIELVGKTEGWSQVPPGTRVSTYENAEYKAAAPFWEISQKAIQNADYETPTVQPVPYVGIQYLSIPEFQELGEQVSQYAVDYLTDKTTLDQFLEECQNASEAIAVKGGYKNQ